MTNVRKPRLALVLLDALSHSSTGLSLDELVQVVQTGGYYVALQTVEKKLRGWTKSGRVLRVGNKYFFNRDY